MNETDFTHQRKNLVKNHIEPLGLSEKINQAFLAIPRHEFVSEDYQYAAYQDNALPIGEGQTISQPSLVALMTNLLSLKGDEKVLEIGTGSGYQAAVLSKLANEVYTVERIPILADRAKKILKKLDFNNVKVFATNGSMGLTKFAPYDAIIVTAAAKEVPDSLIAQLKEEGRMVIPVGEQFGSQSLLVGEKEKGELRTSEVEHVRFVPLVSGEEGEA